MPRYYSHGSSDVSFRQHYYSYSFISLLIIIFYTPGSKDPRIIIITKSWRNNNNPLLLSRELYHCDKHFSQFYPQDGGLQKSTVIDIEKNYATVILCIAQSGSSPAKFSISSTRISLSATVARDFQREV